MLELILMSVSSHHLILISCSMHHLSTHILSKIFVEDYNWKFQFPFGFSLCNLVRTAIRIYWLVNISYILILYDPKIFNFL